MSLLPFGRAIFNKEAGFQCLFNGSLTSMMTLISGSYKENIFYLLSSFIRKKIWSNRIKWWMITRDNKENKWWLQVTADFIQMTLLNLKPLMCQLGKAKCSQTQIIQNLWPHPRNVRPLGLLAGFKDGRDGFCCCCRLEVVFQ